ncbi:MAG TPA: hypothetical protein DCS66_03975, partial [Flavobacteriaceae bacterium]|nr:hypothetical protein [Flavobacteriaceae bacterium]
AAEKWWLKDEEAFEGKIGEFIEAALIGTWGGLMMGGLGAGGGMLRQGINRKRINDILKINNTNNPDNQLNSIEEAFSPSEVTPVTDQATPISIPIPAITDTQMALTRIPGAKEKLITNVNESERVGSITTTEGEQIQENFRDTEGAVNTLDHLGLGNNTEAVSLVIEKNRLDNIIKKVDDKDLTQPEKKRIEEIGLRLNELINTAKIEHEETVGMGVIPTRQTKKEEVSAEEQAELNQISIDLYKESTNETTRNNAIKDIIEDNAGFFLSDKGGINFDTNFKGYINKNTGKPITRQEVLNEINAEIPSIINAFTQDKGANFTTYAGVALNKRLPTILESLIGAKEAATTKEMTAEEMAKIPEQKTEEITDKEFKEKESILSIPIIEKQLAGSRPNILVKTKEDIKSFIASELGKVKEIGKKGKTAITKLTPTAVAQSLVEAAGTSQTRKILAKDIGGYNTPKYKKFVKDAIEGGLINVIPFATMKKRFGTVPGFNIEKIGRETLGAGTGIYKLSGLQEQALIDFYTSDKVTKETRQGRYKSFVNMLAQDTALEQFQEMKIDKDFMNDLSISLKEAGVEMTADEFIDQVEKKFDKRTPEKRSLDVIIKSIDKSIEALEGLKADPNVLGMNVGVLEAGRQTVILFLRGIKTALQKGLSFIQALEQGVQQVKDLIAVTAKQEQIVDTTLGTLTEAEIDNYEIVQQRVQLALLQVAKDKYNNVADYEVGRIKKLLKRRNISNEAKQIALKNFLKFINTSFQKNSDTHQLWEGANAQAAYKYWEKQLGIKLSDYGFKVSKGSILLNGEKIIDSGPLRPSNAPTRIKDVYTKKGFKGALDYIRKNIAKSDKTSNEAIDFIVETIGDFVADGKIELAVQLLDIMGYASDSALRMVGKIRSIQDNVKAIKVTNKKTGKTSLQKQVEYEHTPPIAVLRDKIRGVLKTNQNVESLKQEIRDILNESYVDIIGKQEAKKLNDTKEKGGLGRKITGENLSRYDGVVNQKNLVMIERSPDALIESEKKAKKKIDKLTPTITDKDQTTAETKET